MNINNEQIIGKYKVDNNLIKAEAVLLRGDNDLFYLNEILLIIKMKINEQDFVKEFKITDKYLSGLQQCIYMHESNPLLYKEVLYKKLIKMYSDAIAEKFIELEDTNKLLESIYFEKY